MKLAIWQRFQGHRNYEEQQKRNNQIKLGALKF
jgi:hypothetical protein